MWVDLCTCIKWFWDVIFTQRIFPVLFVECVALPRFFSGGDFLRNLNSSGPSREVSLTAAKISKAFFSLYTLYTIVLILYRYNTHGFSYGPIGKKDSINHSSPVFLVLVPSAKKTSAAKSQDYEFVLIIQWSSVKHLALEIWYPIVWISH